MFIIVAEERTCVRKGSGRNKERVMERKRRPLDFLWKLIGYQTILVCRGWLYSRGSNGGGRGRKCELGRGGERGGECPLCRWNVSGTVIVIYLSEMKVNSDVQPAWSSLSANHENKLSHWNRYSSGTRQGSHEGWTAELYRLLLGNSAEFN